MTANKTSGCCWVDKQTFVTSSLSEVTVWSLSALEDPLSILETGKSDIINNLESKLSSKGRFSVAAISTAACSIFKLNFNKP